MARRAPVDLLPQAADEDVDGAVAMRLAAAPELLEQLVAGDDAAAVERELVEEPELGRRQLGADAVDEGLHLARVDPELLDLDRLAARRLLAADRAAGRGADARDELLHRERLDEVVVGADLERVDAVVLGAARGDDDDRRADPLVAGGLDELPAVNAREHQIEHADVGLLVAKPRETLRPVPDGHRIEAGGAEMARHSLGDDLVVLDDQNLRHACSIIGRPRLGEGSRMVKEW